MKNKFKTLFVSVTAITLFIGLTGCSSPSLTKEQCLSKDWQAIGYNDGVIGHYPERINDHQEACAETGVIPNFSLWQKGREQGLTHYCTAENATRLGQLGYSFNAVCSNNKLQKIHQKAYQGYQATQQLIEDRRTLAQHKAKLQKLLNGEMLEFKTEKEARNYMLSLQKQIFILEQRIAKNEQQD
ncbi:lipoprotein [Phocoenobacter uteri]|uniref:Lipoprotein n=1 Tax=Phocoenobacter uteri TaxID=146806 RepID=A0A379CCX7_9PAST|nr:DUF2799 domain-containing protein [Phocoenobacter uteri]MDG6881497.1 hypothetical protein [Phocoenobacter uteri]SUB59527.1 lipoprotein [Phocoenobacter uteri]